MSESNCYSMSLTWRVTVTLHSLYMIRNCQTLSPYPLPVLLGLPWIYLSSLSCVCSKRRVPTQRIQSFLALRSPTAHLFLLIWSKVEVMLLFILLVRQTSSYYINPRYISRLTTYFYYSFLQMYLIVYHNWDKPNEDFLIYHHYLFHLYGLELKLILFHSKMALNHK